MQRNKKKKEAKLQETSKLAHTSSKLHNSDLARRKKETAQHGETFSPSMRAMAPIIIEPPALGKDHHLGHTISYSLDLNIPDSGCLVEL
jgi:hypothetical protein